LRLGPESTWTSNKGFGGLAIIARKKGGRPEVVRERGKGAKGWRSFSCAFRCIRSAF